MQIGCGAASCGVTAGIGLATVCGRGKASNQVTGAVRSFDGVIQRCGRFAFKPLASARAVTDTPGRGPIRDAVGEAYQE